MAPATEKGAPAQAANMRSPKDSRGGDARREIQTQEAQCVKSWQLSPPGRGNNQCEGGQREGHDAGGSRNRAGNGG